MKLPSLTKLFDVTASTEYGDLASKYTELQGELKSISVSYDRLLKDSEVKTAIIKTNEAMIKRHEEKSVKATKELAQERKERIIAQDKAINANEEVKRVAKENERLRGRLSKVGLKLVALRKELATLKRNNEVDDVVDTIPDTKVEVAASGIARVKQIDPDVELSATFMDSSYGYFVNTVFTDYMNTASGAGWKTLFEEFGEKELNAIKHTFARQVANFNTDAYNAVCVAASLYHDGWDTQADGVVATKLLKEMGSQAGVAHAIMHLKVRNAKFKKPNGRSLATFKELVTYLTNNTDQKNSVDDLCTSYEVSKTTVYRFVYLTLLYTQKSNWGAEI